MVALHHIASKLGGCDMAVMVSKMGGQEIRRVEGREKIGSDCKR